MGSVNRGQKDEFVCRGQATKHCVLWKSCLRRRRSHHVVALCSCQRSSVSSTNLYRNVPRPAAFFGIMANCFCLIRWSVAYGEGLNVPLRFKKAFILPEAVMCLEKWQCQSISPAISYICFFLQNKACNNAFWYNHFDNSNLVMHIQFIHRTR